LSPQASLTRADALGIDGDHRLEAASQYRRPLKVQGKRDDRSEAAMRRIARALIGLLIAPMTPTLLLMLFSAFFAGGRDIQWVANMNAILGYPAAILFGIPTYAYFERKNYRALWHYMFGGAFIGALLYYSIIILTFLSTPVVQSNLVLSPFTFLGIFLGALSAVTFWLIAVRSRSENH
jgi:hypothetical protein